MLKARYLPLFVFVLACKAAEQESLDTFLAQTPKRFGKQEKAGPLPAERWLPTDFNQSRLHDWLFQRSVYKADASQLPTERWFPLTAPCGVWFCREANAIVLTHATSKWLLKALGGACPTNGRSRRRKRSAQCFEPLSRVLGTGSKDYLKKLWAQATVVAAAPNPYAHAARAYAAVTGSWRSAKERCAPLPFSAFAADPARLALQDGMFRCSAASEEDEDAPKAKEADTTTPPDVLRDLTLVEPLSACLTAASGDWAADYLVRAELPYVAADLEAAAALIAERRWRQQHSSAAVTSGDSSSSSMEDQQQQQQVVIAPDRDFVLRHFGAEPGPERLAALYAGCGEECRQRVAEFYRADLQLLGLAE